MTRSIWVGMVSCIVWTWASGCGQGAEGWQTDVLSQEILIIDFCNHDGICDGPFETCLNCLHDCDGLCCGNNTCEAPWEDSQSCPADCPGNCGNGYCTGTENRLNCPEDCEYCGNGYCSSEEFLGVSCFADCVDFYSCCDPAEDPGEGWSCCVDGIWRPIDKWWPMCVEGWVCL